MIWSYPKFDHIPSAGSGSMGNGILAFMDSVDCYGVDVREIYHTLDPFGKEGRFLGFVYPVMCY